MLKNLVLGFFRNFRKFIPMLVLLVLFALAAGTDIFSASIRESLQAAAVAYFHKLLPFAIDLLIAALMVNLAWLFYKPVMSGFERILDRSGASPRGRELSIKLLKFFYWAVVVLFVLTLTAAEVIGRFVVGFGVFGAALTLSMQGAANDFICGLLIQLTRKVTENDDVKLEGLDVKGKVSNVGYLASTIESDTDLVRVPNREIWARAVKVAKPKKSSILLPPGVNYPRAANSVSGEKK